MSGNVRLLGVPYAREFKLGPAAPAARTPLEVKPYPSDEVVSGRVGDNYHIAVCPELTRMKQQPNLCVRDEREANASEQAVARAAH
jgi:hypothetical protein